MAGRSVSSGRLRTGLVGCGGMGRSQAKVIAGIDDYELVAVCDIVEANAAKTAAAHGVKAYTSYEEMLAAERLDVVAVCTTNVAHAAPVIAAAKAGVRGVYCEKPMAVNMAEAREMVESCEKAGAALVINHQRRLGPDLTEARRLIEAGAIGDVKYIRSNNAGDILSDGTHAVDSLLWLAGDSEPKWVFGQIHRHVDQTMRDKAAEQAKKTGFDVEAGFRYGHPVENGGMGVAMLANDIRLEIFCGDMRDGHRAYQDYEVFGANGRLWRTGDGVRPNLYIQDAQGGEWVAGVDEKWVYRPLHKPGVRGVWRPVELPAPAVANGIEDGYRRMVRMIRNGEPHPMCGRNALRGFEIVMAIYESARVHAKLEMPLRQDAFPLQLMVDAGVM